MTPQKHPKMGPQKNWGRTTYIINSGSVIIVLWFHGFTTKDPVKPPKRPQKFFLWSEGGLGTLFGVFLWSKFGHEKGHLASIISSC